MDFQVKFKEQCYEYFAENGIKKLDDLKDVYSSNPIKGISRSTLETYFSVYKKEQKQPKKEDLIKVVTINDLHIPYHNKEAIKSVFDFLADFQPDKLILAGDILDFYMMSSFDKDPSRKMFIQDEIDIFHDLFKNYKKDVYDSEITFIKGNHEARLERQVWQNPGFYGLKALQLPQLLGLKELDMGYEKYQKTINGFQFTHGKVVRAHSSYSAKSEYEHRGCSGMSGHTHRMGSYYKKTEDADHAWFENACLCRRDPEYVEGTPNWQNGFSVTYFEDNAFEVHPIYIKESKFRFNGKCYQ